MSLASTRINPQEIASLKDGDGYGTLLVTNLHVLVGDPWLLNVVNDNRQCYMAHIVANATQQNAELLLDSAFHDYVNGCCHNLGCDATVEYIVDGQVVLIKRYGWDDGSYSMTFKVYCKLDVRSLLPTLLANASNDTPLVVITYDTSDMEWGFAVHKSTGSPDSMEDTHDFLRGR